MRSNFWSTDHGTSYTWCLKQTVVWGIHNASKWLQFLLTSINKSNSQSIGQNGTSKSTFC